MSVINTNPKLQWYLIGDLCFTRTFQCHPTVPFTIRESVARQRYRQNGEVHVGMHVAQSWRETQDVELGGAVVRKPVTELWTWARQELQCWELYAQVHKAALVEAEQGAARNSDEEAHGVYIGLLATDRSQQAGIARLDVQTLLVHGRDHLFAVTRAFQVLHRRLDVHGGLEAFAFPTDGGSRVLSLVLVTDVARRPDTVSTSGVVAPSSVSRGTTNAQVDRFGQPRTLFVQVHGGDLLRKVVASTGTAPVTSVASPALPWPLEGNFCVRGPGVVGRIIRSQGDLLVTPSGDKVVVQSMQLEPLSRRLFVGTTGWLSRADLLLELT